MSYSLIGRFVDVNNKKHIIDAELGFLKCLTDRSYSPEFSNVNSTSETKDDEYPEITSYVEYKFADYYKNELLNEDWFSDVIQPYKQQIKTGFEHPCYSINETKFNEVSSKIEKFAVRPSLDEMLSKDFEKSDGFFSLYTKLRDKCYGEWYTLEDFKRGRETILKEYNEYFEKKKNHDQFRISKDYYEMSEEAKNSFLGEYGDLEEYLAELQYQVDAVNKIINILDFLNEDVGYAVLNQFDETSYIWNYDDKRKVEVFIFVD